MRRAVFGALPEADGYKALFYSMVGQIGYSWQYAGWILGLGWLSQSFGESDEQLLLSVVAVALLGGLTVYQTVQGVWIIQRSENTFFPEGGPLTQYSCVTLFMWISAGVPAFATAGVLMYFVKIHALTH